MKNTTLLIIIAIVLILLITFRNPINMALSRGLRNNNPGNIRLTYDSKGKKVFWIGEIEGKDKSFKTFKSLEYGYRAMFVTLNSYLKKGVNTIEKIVNRYAPAEDNNEPAAYINTVTRISGLEPNRVISSNEQLQKIIKGMSFVENGVEADEAKILKGYQLYLTT
jgi:hypothetical protein